ncbi:MAG TPA: RsmB/NOP family class I SAM-dependent RNA methyltransferase [Candidatus Bathyarchaeia archaeon]
MIKEAWTLAIESLSWMEMEKLSERLALARTVRQLGIDNINAVRLAHGLVCETVRRQNFIDAFINNTLKPEMLNEFDLGVQAFLRLYVYQTRIAKDWAKIDIKEAESIAGVGRSILGWKTLRRVERVLGKLLTEKPATILQGLGDEERIGLLTFHPSWFVKYCFRIFGRSETITMLKASVESPPVYIRLNTLKASDNEILQRLADEGLTTEKVEQLTHTHKIIAAKHPLTQMQSFREGLFYIQDKASSFAVEIAYPKSGMTVIDACAAPGAKTTYLAQLMQNKGVIYSVDYSRRRMSVWQREVARMGVENAAPIITDACHPLPLTVEADMIVLDPPCTSTGVFGKLPSAKWRLDKRSIDKMAEIQWKMINSCAENVKPKGYLVYSTCSITVEENEMIIERFLKWHSEFSLAKITSKMSLPGLRGLSECQRLYPHINQCNGLFIAKLIRE